MRFNRPSRAYAAKFHPRARDFALSRRPRNADIPTVARHSRRPSLCPSRTLKKRRTARPTLSLSLSLSPVCVSLRLTHVHTAMACLFAPCANCCILHACEAISFSLTLFPHLAFIFSRPLPSLIVSLSLHFVSSACRNIFVCCHPNDTLLETIDAIFLLINYVFNILINYLYII